MTSDVKSLMRQTTTPPRSSARQIESAAETSSQIGRSPARSTPAREIAANIGELARDVIDQRARFVDELACRVDAALQVVHDLLALRL